MANKEKRKWRNRDYERERERQVKRKKKELAQKMAPDVFRSTYVFHLSLLLAR